jgi:hypothetical protein
VPLPLLKPRPRGCQDGALDRFAAEAGSVKLLDPTSQVAAGETSGGWKIALNTPVKRAS